MCDTGAALVFFEMFRCASFMFEATFEQSCTLSQSQTLYLG